MHHPVFRFGAEYAAGKSGDRTIDGVITGGYLLADWGGVQNMAVDNTNSRGFIFSTDQCAKVNVGSPNRVATSGAPIRVRGTSHCLVGGTYAGEIHLEADSDTCTVVGNVSRGVIDLGSGNTTGPRQVTAWQPIPYQGSWADYGGGYQPGEFRLNGDDVEFQGAIAGGSGNICAMPPGHVPAATMGFHCPSNTGADIAYVEINAGSVLALVGYDAGGNNSFIDLSGIKYARAT